MNGPHPSRARKSIAVALCSLLALLSATGCDKKDGSGSTGSDAPASKEEEKKEKVDALLRENGIDPTTLQAGSEKKAAGSPDGGSGDTAGSPEADGSPSDAGPSGGAQVANQEPTETAGPGAVRYTIQVSSPGAEPRQALRYAFGENEKRNLSLDLKTTSALTINGQPLQTAPPVQVTVTGTSTTLATKDGVAQRENVFSSLVPSVKGLPPEMVPQVKAQYDLLKGLRLIETVNQRGELLNVDVPVQEQVQNPQVLVLLQLLQDTLSRSRAPLPEEPVGKGAKWKATASADNGGVRIQDEVEASLVSLSASRAILELGIKQTSPGGKLQLPQLPPGASVELLGVSGAGSGQVEVDLKTLQLTAKMSIKTSRDTKTIDPSRPEPILETVETTTQFEVRLR